MKQNVMQKWVAALRSGEYEQGRERLCRLWDDEPPKYCCLGVLCELAVKEGVIPPHEELSHSAAYGAVNERYQLPREVRDWADMKSDNGRWNGNTSLTCMNDEGVAFPDIADFIERQWETL